MTVRQKISRTNVFVFVRRSFALGSIECSRKLFRAREQSVLCLAHTYIALYLVLCCDDFMHAKFFFFFLYSLAWLGRSVARSVGGEVAASN